MITNGYWIPAYISKKPLEAQMSYHTAALKSGCHYVACFGYSPLDTSLLKFHTGLIEGPRVIVFQRCIRTQIAWVFCCAEKNRGDKALLLKTSLPENL